MKRLANAVRKRQHSLEARLAHRFSAESQTKHLYVSHHKCATQYVLRILYALCKNRRWPAIKVDWRQPLSSAEIHNHKFLLLQDYATGIIDFDTVEGQGFHVIRDPRDILVSMYFSHRDSHVVTDQRAFAALENDPDSPWAEILQNRAYLPTVSIEDGLCHLLETSHYFGRVMDEIAVWNYDNPRFYETRFERLTVDPTSEFAAIFDFLGIGVDSAELHTLIEQNSFKNLKKSSNHYRKGKAGDWANHLTGTAKDRFKQQFGDLLIQLDYAEGKDW